MVATFARDRRRFSLLFSALAAIAILASFMVPTAHAVAAKSVAFDVEPSPVTAGQRITPAVTVNILTQNGTLEANSTALVTITIADGPPGGQLAGDNEENAVEGVATFTNLRLTLRGTYTFAANSPGLVGDTSNSFLVTGAADDCNANGCSVSDPDGTNATTLNRVTGSAAIQQCTAVDDTFLSYDETVSFAGCGGTCDDPVLYLWDCGPPAGTIVRLVYTADKTVVQEDIDRGAPHFTLWTDDGLGGQIVIPFCAKKGVIDPGLTKCISKQFKTKAGDLVSEILSTPEDPRGFH